MGLFGPNIKKMEAKRDVEGLVKALKTKNEDVRRLAAAALGNIGDAKAVEYLIEALKNEEWSIQNIAAKSLYKIGEPSVESLIEALKDENEDVRRLAAWSLGKIGDARAVEPLLQLIKDDKNEFVRKGTIKALGELRDSRAIEPLLRVLFASNGNIGGEREALLKIAPSSTICKEIMQDAIDASGFYESFWAVESLCSIKSPVTSNLLILISKREDVMVTDHDERGKPSEELKDFGKERQMAIDELARRGSPTYDSSVFLKSSKK